MSNHVTQRVLDSIFNAQAFAPPSSLWFALFNTDPTAANTGVEVSGEGYQRVQISAMTFAAMVGGRMTTSNTARVTLPRATGTWTSANFWAIFDAQTGGNLIVKEALLVSANVVAGQQPEFDVGDLVVTLE
jgi:hypothetical protein